MLLQIDHDTRRLYPDMSFFQHPTPYPQTDGSIVKIGSLKRRVDKTTLPSQHIATSRGGVKNVSNLSNLQLAQGEGELAIAARILKVVVGLIEDVTTS